MRNRKLPDAAQILAGPPAQAIPQSELRLFPDAGHLVMREQPGAVAPAIAEFLAKPACCAVGEAKDLPGQA